MPEMPEVEVLRRHLEPLIRGRVIRDVEVRRAKIVAPDTPAAFRKRLLGAKFTGVSRRGKYLLFALRPPGRQEPFQLLGHLGMTGRMFLQPSRAAMPRHTAVVMRLGKYNFVYEDTRYFGRMSLDTRAVAQLGPEPLEPDFPVAEFRRVLRRSAQAIKVKLLDQSLVAGIGNIYASEILFLAGIAPRRAARSLKAPHMKALLQAMRQVLTEAIEGGSTIPLDFAGTGKRDGLFYFGRADGAPDYYTERLRVYDRAKQPCLRCGQPIRKMVQAARSTFYCPKCQK
ncbi:MAG: bifunctional DNA-formamidopyrimidine glycosylase/DNA-(apurinic or apyrimidinic site) lyase [Verrucomicrobiota bacterium]